MLRHRECSATKAALKHSSMPRRSAKRCLMIIARRSGLRSESPPSTESASSGPGASGSRPGNSPLTIALQAAAIPHGYTLSIWGSGAFLLRYRGVPDFVDVLTFIGGSSCAFALLASLGRFVRGHSDHTGPSGRRLLTGSLGWASAGVAVGAAAGLAQVRGWWAWPTASFAATAVYFVAVSFLLERTARRVR